MNTHFFSRVFECLMITDPELKVNKTYQCFDDLTAGRFIFDHGSEVVKIPVPGRPAKPELVDPRAVSRRSINSTEGRSILAHAVAHIEFNAINLALDAAYRFRGMPDDFYTDWMKVAKEEAYHFSLMTAYLKRHGCRYGDFTAHNGLWEMALKTDHNLLERMALVPRVLEARGLDVTPGMIKKLENAGDMAFVDCLKIIYEEEIGHVAIGSRWFFYCCKIAEVDSRTTFINLLKQHMNSGLRGPFDEWSRLQAGFTELEMSDLKLLEDGLKN
ncbi:MAG: ferritin-like domain-containing protein [Gammaproteobacteria bacterium]|nr:ferritin-like domain-containing protein [Gammaproteobacteria bacterium]